VDEAGARCEAARALAVRTGHRPSIFWADHTGALLHQFRREPNEATVRARAAIRAAEELDLTQWTAWGMLFDGWLAAEQGRYDEGIAAMKRGLASYRATGAELGRVFFLTALAEASGRAGRVDDALTAVDEALTAAQERGEVYYEPETHRVRGELLLAHDRDAGERALRRALTLARTHGARVLELRAATGVARALLSRGRVADAREILAPVHAAFGAGADTVDVREAHQLLIVLDGPRARRRRAERRRA
jgi:adenylate cyclase